MKPFSWKDVRPGDAEWEIKLQLDRKIRQLNIAALIAGVLFVLALIADRIWHWSGK